MATKQEKWQEIANRGLQDKFDPATRAKFDEAVKRGLILVRTPQQDEQAPVAGQVPSISTGNVDVPDVGDKPYPDLPLKPERGVVEVVEG